MPKYLDLTGLEYNNSKLISKLESLKNSDTNIISGSKTFSGSSVVFLEKDYTSNLYPLNEQVNGLDTFYAEGDNVDGNSIAPCIQVPLIHPENLKAGDTICVNFYAAKYEIENLAIPSLVISTWVNNSLSNNISSFVTDNSFTLSDTYNYYQAKITLTGNGTVNHKLFIAFETTDDTAITGFFIKISNITATLSQSQMPYSINNNDLYDIIDDTKTSLTTSINNTIYNGKLVNTITSVASGGTIYLKGNYFNKLTAAAPDKFTIKFQNPGRGEPEYVLDFTTGTTAPTITMPSGVTWLNGAVPTLEASTHYQLSVLNKCAIIAKF